MTRRNRGGALLLGLLLLSVLTLLALAGASAAHVELQLARNEAFRENAASAAAAGIELAIRQIVTSASPELVPPSLTGSLPDGAGRFEVRLTRLGLDTSLPQPPGAGLAGIHFDITSVGRAPRGATDRQRSLVLRVIAAEGAPTVDCEPLAPGVRCARAGELRRLSWQRVPGP